MHVFRQFRAGAQAGKRADSGPTRNVAAFEVAEAHDLGPGFDGDAGAEDDVRADHRIAPDVGVECEEHGFRGHQRHAVVQRLGAGAGLKGGLGLRQLRTGVDAKGLGLGADHQTGRQAARAGQFHDVGQVVFAGGIGIADLRDKVEQQCCIGADHAGIAEGYRAHLVRGILVFDDPFQCLAIRDQATVAARIGGMKAQHHDRVARAGIEHRLQGFGADEGGVAVEDDRIALCARQQGGGLGDGMAGAELLCLDHHLCRVVKGAGGGADGLGPHTGHHDRVFRIQRLTGPHRVMQ